MLDQLKSLLGLEDDNQKQQPVALDKNLAAGALMVQVIVADGKITPEEEAKLLAVLEEHYAVSKDEAKELARAAQTAQSESIDLYSFTSVLKREMEESERLALVEDLWEMVYADGQIHEFEDNIVWRVAELIGIQSRDRMVLKQRVLARHK